MDSLAANLGILRKFRQQEWLSSCFWSDWSCLFDIFLLLHSLFHFIKGIPNVGFELETLVLSRVHKQAYIVKERSHLILYFLCRLLFNHHTFYLLLVFTTNRLAHFSIKPWNPCNSLKNLQLLLQILIPVLKFPKQFFFNPNLGKERSFYR